MYRNIVCKQGWPKPLTKCLLVKILGLQGLQGAENRMKDCGGQRTQDRDPGQRTQLGPRTYSTQVPGPMTQDRAEDPGPRTQGLEQRTQDRGPRQRSKEQG